MGTSEGPSPYVSKSQAPTQLRFPFHLAGWLRDAVRPTAGPRPGRKGAARGQGYQLCSLPPPDDGKLSFEEFQNYFADGVLSPRELRELFSGIDGHLTE